MPSNYPYYAIWTGSLNLGDTVGVFNDAVFVGLLTHLPFTVTFMPPGTAEIELLLVTTEVEIYDDPSTGKPLKHSIYLDWKPGDPFPHPVGTIDAEEVFEGHPEIHLIKIPASAIPAGK